MRLARKGGWVAVAGLLLFGCADDADPVGVGSMRPRAAESHGALALQRYGCGTCHRIPGIAGAEGVVGPPLVDMARRVYVGRGLLPNTPENLIRFIRAPQALVPQSVMPDMQVTATDAADMVAYLYRHGGGE